MSVSDIRIGDISQIIEYAQNNLTKPTKDPMYPWVVVRSVENRIKTTDDRKITMNNSDLKRLINGIARNEDKKENIPDQTLNSISNIKEAID